MFGFVSKMLGFNGSSVSNGSSLPFDVIPSDIIENKIFPFFSFSMGFNMMSVSKGCRIILQNKFFSKGELKATLDIYRTIRTMELKEVPEEEQIAFLKEFRDSSEQYTISIRREIKKVIPKLLGRVGYEIPDHMTSTSKVCFEAPYSVKQDPFSMSGPCLTELELGFVEEKGEKIIKRIQMITSADTMRASLRTSVPMSFSSLSIKPEFTLSLQILVLDKGENNWINIPYNWMIRRALFNRTHLLDDEKIKIVHQTLAAIQEQFALETREGTQVFYFSTTQPFRTTFSWIGDLAEKIKQLKLNNI